jgi:formylmethanofuran dehydrogenase subunit D
LSERLTLITGRTKEQGQALHLGKGSCAYRDATTWMEMNAQDMARLGIADGDVVHVQTEAGHADLPVRAGTLPAGVVFMPAGPAANKLAGADTEGTGMPLLKGLTIAVASRPAGQAKSRPLCVEAKQSPLEPS